MSGISSFVNRIISCFKPSSVQKTVPTNRVCIDLSQKPDKVELTGKTDLSGKLRNLPTREQSIKDVADSIDEPLVKNIENSSKQGIYETARKIASKTFGIPLDIMPQNKIIPLLGMDMSYFGASHLVAINHNGKFADRADFFAGLMHEFTHVRQHLDVYRTEGLNNEAIKSFAKIYSNMFNEELVKRFKNISQPEAQLHKLALNIDDELFEKLKTAHKLDKKALTEFIKEAQEKLYKQQFNFLTKLKNKAIEEMGLIHAGSEEAISNKRTYEELKRLYGNKITAQEAIESPIEQEAYKTYDICADKYDSILGNRKSRRIN